MLSEEVKEVLDSFLVDQEENDLTVSPMSVAVAKDFVDSMTVWPQDGNVILSFRDGELEAEIRSNGTIVISTRYTVNG